VLGSVCRKVIRSRSSQRNTSRSERQVSPSGRHSAAPLVSGVKKSCSTASLDSAESCAPRSRAPIWKARRCHVTKWARPSWVPSTAFDDSGSRDVKKT
jgi:hypothetical protein